MSARDERKSWPRVVVEWNVAQGDGENATDLEFQLVVEVRGDETEVVEAYQRHGAMLVASDPEILLPLLDLGLIEEDARATLRSEAEAHAEDHHDAWREEQRRRQI